MNLINALNKSKKIYDVEMKGIPKKGFCLGVSSGNSLTSKTIKFYSKHFEKIQNEFLASHAFAMFDMTVYESNALGNQERHISKYVKNGHEFWLFAPGYINKYDYQNALAYAKGSLGRMYDYPGFLRFVFKFIPQLKYADFCSEFTAKIVEYLKLPFVNLKAEDISPARILRHCMLRDNIYHLVAHYKNGKQINEKNPSN